jgi:magnesium-transporting ATPase (P-type)
MLRRNPNFVTDRVTNVNFNDDAFYSHRDDPDHENYENINQYILFLALCHTIVIDHRKGFASYSASSPDELALVNAAKFFGISFIDRTDDNYRVLKMPDGST